jgi:hypothetical protein
MKKRSLQSYPIKLESHMPKMVPVAVKPKKVGRNKKLYTPEDFEKKGLSILDNIEELRR